MLCLNDAFKADAQTIYVNDKNLVEIRGVYKTYPGGTRAAVGGVSLTITKDKIFGLLGPNGAGKTTLLSMLCGLLAPSRGELRILGHDVGKEPKKIKQLLGLVPQDLALYPGLSARENLVFFGRIQGLRGERLRRRIEACLEIAGLEGLAEQRVESYSGGLKRRLNLVIGLIHEPQLLILDEPTVGIDPQSRRFIHESLHRLHDQGMGIIYTTHYMDEVEQLCDELAIIDHGKIIAEGSIQALMGKFQDGAIQARTERPMPQALADRLQALPHVTATSIEGQMVTVKSSQPQATAHALLALLQEHNIALVSLSLGAVHLEQVFLALTGTRLRD